MKNSLVEALSSTKETTDIIDKLTQPDFGKKKRWGGPRPLEQVITPEAQKLAEECDLKTLLKLRKEQEKQLNNVKVAARLRRKQYDDRGVEKKAVAARSKRNYHLQKAQETDIAVEEKKIKKNKEVIIRRRNNEASL